MKAEPDEPGIGPTRELSLRASVGVLVALLFKNPADGQMMLALERTATRWLSENGPVTEVRVKPFGGGVRLLNPEKLKKHIGEFHYDSERSREEHDFRIQMNPLNWGKVPEICHEHCDGRGEGILDFSPVRELREELCDSLQVRVSESSYVLHSRRMIVEDSMTGTNNVHARGRPTVRVYFIYDAMLEDAGLVQMLMENSCKYSDCDLRRKADEDALGGGKGRANAVLTTGLNEIRKFYRSIPEPGPETLTWYMGHQFEGNVPAILSSTDQPDFC